MRRLYRGFSAIGNKGRALRVRLCRSFIGKGGGRRASSTYESAATRLILAAFLSFAVFTPQALAATFDVVFPKDTLYTITSDVEFKKTADILAAIKQNNARLDAFKIERRKDNITLAISMFTNDGKLDFKLVGEKNQFYKMAMGFGLEKILANITAADKTISGIGAKKDGENIIITLTTAGSPLPTKVVSVKQEAKPTPKQEAKPTPKQEAKPTPKPAAASAPTPRSRVTRTTAKPETTSKNKFVVTQPKTQKKPKVATKAEQPKQMDIAPPGMKKPDTSVALEKQIETAYVGALESGDPRKLIAFAKKYPDSPKAKKALKTAERTREEAAYKRAAKDNTVKSFNGFLTNFPKASRAKDAEAKIAEIKKQQKAAKKNKKAAEAKKKRDKEINSAYAKAKKSGKIAVLEKFIANYPKSNSAKQAKKLIAALKDDKAFNAGKDSLAGLKKYLDSYPKGRSAQIAATMIAQREKAQAPKGIIALAVKTPPKLDGSSGDAVWQSASTFRVNLTRHGGKNKINAADVRAVHSGGRIYFLVQWRDSSQDTSYRPFVWDKTKKRHQQSGQLDDAVAIAFYMNGKPADSCMLGGTSQRVDLWMWRAFLSGLSGYASDQNLETSRKPLRRSVAHVAKSGGGQIWIRNLADKGQKGWRSEVPAPRAPKKTLPGYVATKASGSAADVLSRGAWSKGLWTVEFSRKFSTGNKDDADIPKKGEIMISFSAYDKADKDEHSSSPLVKLIIQ